MSDRPIIFSAPMIRALLDGRKTQTRRMLKWQPAEGEAIKGIGDGTWRRTNRWGVEAGPIAVPHADGDRLWVRETWNVFAMSQNEYWPITPIPETDPRQCEDLRSQIVVDYAAVSEFRQNGREIWRSPIYMPRWASRLTLTVTDVRVQRLQEISEGDAEAEGLAYLPASPPFAERWGVVDDPFISGPGPVEAFMALWNSIHGPGSWDANPWVAAITFTMRKGGIDA